MLDPCAFAGGITMPTGVLFGPEFVAAVGVEARTGASCGVIDSDMWPFDAAGSMAVGAEPSPMFVLTRPPES